MTEEPASKPISTAEMDAFAAELTALTRKHGLVIPHGPIHRLGTDEGGYNIYGTFRGEEYAGTEFYFQTITEIESQARNAEKRAEEARNKAVRLKKCWEEIPA